MLYKRQPAGFGGLFFCFPGGGLRAEGISCPWGRKLRKMDFLNIPGGGCGYGRNRPLIDILSQSGLPGTSCSGIAVWLSGILRKSHFSAQVCPTDRICPPPNLHSGKRKNRVNMQNFVKMQWKMQEKRQKHIDRGGERTYNNKCY